MCLAFFFIEAAEWTQSPSAGQMEVKRRKLACSKTGFWGKDLISQPKNNQQLFRHLHLDRNVVFN